MQFKLKVFPRGHMPTNYPKWFEAKEDYEVRCREADLVGDMNGGRSKGRRGVRQSKRREDRRLSPPPHPPLPHPPLQVAYQRMFEPWYIGHISQVPFHDSLFRGYGLNKIAHVATLNYFNYSFVINHAAWLVHRPHEDTAVRGEKRRGGKRKRGSAHRSFL
jgi:hypothetical protein